MATFLPLLKETGMRSWEAWQLTWDDLDNETKTLRTAPEKNSNPRIMRISPKLKLIAMLEALPRNYGSRIFSYSHQQIDDHRNIFIQQRKRIANKLKNPRLNQISFKTLRHWKATMEYHRTKDILHIMNVLGHKNIENTLVYTHLVNLEGDEYVSKVAWNLEEACKLVDAGFDYVTDVEGAKLFRKRK